MRIDEVSLKKLLNLGILVKNFDNNLVLSPLLETNFWELSLGFEDVAIKQKKNKCNSRLDVKTDSEIIKGVERPIPMIAANMSTVCDAAFCIELYKLGALGVMHRAATDAIILEEVEKISEACSDVAGSVGVGESQIKLATNMVERGCNIIFIDIAHGFSDSVIMTGKMIKDRHPDIKVVIGNTTNLGLLHEIKDFAAACKVGIAQGAACETKNTAGCTEKQFSAVFKFKELSRQLGIPIISDGGIKEPADLVKSIGAGASSAMMGSVFARCPESAAPLAHTDKGEKKIFAGMASRFVQERWKGGLKDGTCPEGGVRLLDLGESVNKLLERWVGALKSGITYGGGIDIKSFQESVEFVRLA